MPDISEIRRRAVILLRRMGYTPSSSKDVLPLLLSVLQSEHEKVRTLSRYLPPRICEMVEAEAGGIVFTGERRLTTVLFVDICGFTALSEALDSEDVIEVINRIFGVIVRAAMRHGGSVDKYLGDAALVTFGTPVARGDDPQRALSAAQEIMENINSMIFPDRIQKHGFFKLNVSIGVNTGPVVAGNVGAEGRLEYTVIGDTVNVASRLRDLARPGEIVVAEFTRQITSHDFRFTYMGKFKVKGKSGEIPAYILGRRIQRALDFAGERDIPFIGRAEELHWLDGLKDQSLKRKPVVAVISGQPGMGKSRLVNHWIRENLDSTFFKIRITSLFENRGILFNDFHQGILSSLTLNSADPVKKIQRRITAAARLLGGGRIQSNAIAVKMTRLMDSASPSSFSDAGDSTTIFEAALALLSMAASRQPLLIVLDNFQWMDVMSRQAVEWICPRLKDLPVFFIIISRDQSPFPEELKISNQVLEGLGRESALSLTRMLFKQWNIQAVQPEEIVDRAGDHPLFLELLIKHIRDKDLIMDFQDSSLPTDIQSVVQARIDMLGASAKKVLECAAVLGNRVYSGLLYQMLTSISLPEFQLIIADLLVTGYLESGPEEGVYYFQQDLIRQVVYQSVLIARRRELHLIIGNAMEHKSGRRDYSPELIAYHFECSSSPVKALFYIELAAQQANLFYQYFMAISLYERGIKLIDSLEEDRPGGAWRFRYRIGQILHIQGKMNEAKSFFKEALEISKRFKEDLNRAEALEKIGDIHMDQGELLESIPYYQESNRIFQTMMETDGEVRTLSAMGIIHTQQGEWEKAEEAFQTALKRVQTTGNSQLQGSVFTNLGIFHSIRGEIDKAIKNYLESTYWFEEAGIIEGVAQAFHNLGMTYESIPDLEKAEYYYERSMALSREVGDKIMFASTLLNRSQVRFLKGDLDMASAYCLQALTRMRELENPIGVADAYQTLGRIAVKSGKLKRARGLFGLSFRINNQCNNLLGCASAGFEYGRMLLTDGLKARGAHYLRKALAAYEVMQDEENTAKVKKLLALT